ncbi:MAG: hypothetical protein WKF34_05925 [Pyrinomonadaceae bacterium]
MPIDGDSTAATYLTDYDSFAPSVSPDGKLLACVSPPENRVQSARLDIINFETGARLQSFEILPPAHLYPPIRWAPAGDALIYLKTEKGAYNLWKQNLNGGEPKQYTDFNSQSIYNYAFSRGGKRLLIARGDSTVNVVMLKNFRNSGPQ